MQSPRKPYGSRPATPSMSRPASRSVTRSASAMSSRSLSNASAATISSASANANANSNLNSASTSFTGTIEVTVRVKPEDTTGFSSAATLDVDPSRAAISVKDVGTFTFDHVLDTTASNHSLYLTVEPLVDKVLAGYHGTVFAYGMTGSGKTYSMQGSPDSLDPGIIPRVVDHIFTVSDSSVSLSYLEIYNERLHDLLDPDTADEHIKLREDRKLGAIQVHGLKQVSVQSADELLDWIAKGDLLRRTEGTDFNARSSRSHAIVQISITNKSGYTSILYLCDLAGSERAVSQTDRRKEGSFINKSLLTLGTVISRLSSMSSSSASISAMSPSAHIPYRDSKLTRILQPALSGKSLVTVICTIHALDSIETVSTLRFAARAKNITINVKRNDDLAVNAASIALLQHKLESQNFELMRLRQQLENSGSNSGSLLQASESYTAQLEVENRILHERIAHLTRLCDDTQLEELVGIKSTESEKPSSQSVLETRVTEYRAYIEHLEKRLMKIEVEASFSGNVNANTNTATSLKPGSVQSSASIAMPPPSASSSKAHYQDIIEELQEEIRELKESNRDKDKIIEAFRSVSKQSHGHSASFNSQAYARYYHQSVPSAGNTTTSTTTVLSEHDLNHQPDENPAKQ